MEKESSQSVRKDINNYVLPLGVDFDSIPDLSGVNKEKSDFKQIIFMSRLDPKKGLDLLVDSIAILKKKRTDFKLLIVGNGISSYENSIKNRAKYLGIDKYIEWKGFLNLERWEHLKRSDLFVLPSYSENFGIAVVEAMSVGLPVVISDKVGISTEIRSYNAGVVVKCDPAELAFAIDSCLGSPALRSALSESALKLVLEHFDWKKITPRLINAYKAVLNKSS
ncbi:MAG: glycosyltransferase [Planctomycetes bacterium]|nr:glycosyltransferase [Planctomycetota bacterium]